MCLVHKGHKSLTQLLRFWYRFVIRVKDKSSYLSMKYSIVYKAKLFDLYLRILNYKHHTQIVLALH